MQDRNSLWQVVRLIVFVILVFCFSIPAFSQFDNKFYNKANTFFANQEYDKALFNYLKALRDCGNDTAVLLGCARSYAHLEKYQESDQYYTQIFLQVDTVDPALFLEYGSLQLKLGENERARSYYISYNNLLEKNDIRALRYIKSIEDQNKFFNDSSFISVSKLVASTLGEDNSPVIYQNRLYFETNQPSLDDAPLESSLFQASPKNSSLPGLIVKGKATSKYYGAGITIATKSGEVILSRRDEADPAATSILYGATLEEDGTSLSLNDKIVIQSFYTTIESPAVSSSGNILVFSSPSISSSGNWDLFICNKDMHGYSKPMPLNEFINTLGNERFPYLVNDSILFFSSDGQGGLGGLDIYYVNLNNSNSLPINLGFPVNTAFDDYDICLAEDGFTGFLASNREASGSFSDIFSFEIEKFRATGTITDENTGENLKNINLSIEIIGKDTTQLTLADNGGFAVTANPGDILNITINKLGYAPRKYLIDTKTKGLQGFFDVPLGKFTIERIQADSLILKPQETPSVFYEPLAILELAPEPILIEEPAIEIVDEPILLKEIGTIALVQQTIEPKKIETPEVQKTFEDTVNGVVSQNSSGNLPHFRVQIAAARAELTEKMLRNRYHGNRSIFMYLEDGWYKYAIGEYDSYFEANTMRKDSKVKDAFVVAYSGNQKMQIMLAFKEVYTLPKAIEIERSSNGLKEQIGQVESIYYNFNEFMASQNELDKLKPILEQMKNDPFLCVEVDGHTDIQGNKVYNVGLSAERARLLEKYFIDNGVGQSRIKVLSYGESKLKRECRADCTAEIHQQNRRTEVILFRSK